MTTRKLVIFGAEAIARLANFYFSRQSDYHVCAFTVDRDYLRADTFCDLPLVARRSRPSLSTKRVRHVRRDRLHQDEQNQGRKYRAAKELGYTLASFVSPQCSFLTDIPLETIA